MASSNASSICRIEWRPSRALCACLLGLGVLAAVALLLSDLDARLAWPGALLCNVVGAWQVRLAWLLPTAQVIWAGGSEPALITTTGQSRVLSNVSLHFRGPMAVLAGRDADGRRHRLVFWPDTIDAAARRALRLAAAPASSRKATLAVALS